MRWPAWWVAGALAACSPCGCGAASTPVVAPFGPADCQGQLVEVARFADTFPVDPVAVVGNDLAVDGDTLFMAYAFAGPSSGLPSGGGIVAIPLSGGSPRVIAAADPERTSEWLTDSFWAEAGQIHIQTGTVLASLPEDPPSPTPLPVVLADAAGASLYSAYAHDAAFGYFAHGDMEQGVTVLKIPIGGGDPTLLVQETLPNAVLGGMADAGDAVLLHLRWRDDTVQTQPTNTRVWQIAKDGSTHTEVRPDVVWSDPLGYPVWLAWDGENVLGPIVVQNDIVQAQVSPIGTSPPHQIKLGGGVATRRGGEILNVQLMSMPVEGSGALVVATTRGDPAGSVLACGGEPSVASTVLPVGIAANDDDIFVAYHAGKDTVVARVAR